ncbi:MAG TPA: hypothetical protein PLO41_23790 [Rubrivivax sp.]|nr:hypothetical protein [Rubrivivax sp.]
MTRSLKPLTTTLIGGVVFLLPLVVVLVVLGQGVALTARAVNPLVALLPWQNVGGVALAGVAALALLLLLCFGAGLLARAAVGRAFSARFEARLQTLYPRYSVIKAMSQGLHGALGQRVLKPVLVSFDDQQQFAFDIERLDDGRAVLYLPGAPDVWSGSVVLVHAERVQPLDIDAAALAKALQGLGLGVAALLQATPPRQGPA